MNFPSSNRKSRHVTKYHSLFILRKSRHSAVGEFPQLLLACHWNGRLNSNIKESCAQLIYDCCESRGLETAAILIMFVVNIEILFLLLDIIIIISHCSLCLLEGLWCFIVPYSFYSDRHFYHSLKFLASVRLYLVIHSSLY